MSTVIRSASFADSNQNVLNLTIWTAQVLLFVIFGIVGLMRLTQPLPAVAAAMPSIAFVPPELVRFIGIAELLGAIGVLLPSVARIQTWLTPAAGVGLVLMMILAFAFHFFRSEFGMMAVPLALGALAAFVVWGRGHRLSIPPRTGGFAGGN